MKQDHRGRLVGEADTYDRGFHGVLIRPILQTAERCDTNRSQNSCGKTRVEQMLT
jgi:hypothetical protein